MLGSVTVRWCVIADCLSAPIGSALRLSVSFLPYVVLLSPFSSASHSYFRVVCVFGLCVIPSLHFLISPHTSPHFQAKVRLYRFIPIRPGHPVQASLSTYYKLGLGLSMPQGQDHCDLLVVFLYEGKYGVLLIEVKNRAYDEDYNKGVKSKGEKQAQLLRHASKFPHFPSQLKSQADVKAEEETGQEVPEAAVEKRVSTRQADKRKMTAGDTTEKEVAVKKTKTEKGSVKHTQTKEQEAGLTEEGKIESQSIVGLYINMDASDQDKKTMQAVALGKTVFVDNTSQNPFGFRCYAILVRQSLRFSKDILDIIQTLLGRDTTARTPVEKRSANLGHAL